MTSRPTTCSSSSSSSSSSMPFMAATATATTAAARSPSLGAPPIRLRHPLPAPPIQCTSSSSHNKASKPSHAPPPPGSCSSSLSYLTSRSSPRYNYPAASPSTSPYYSSSHPSPAPSTTSSAGGSSLGSATSTLRTPPDLLINGTSVGHTKGAQQLAVNTWNGMLVKPKPPRCLAKHEISKRQSLLKRLPPLTHSLQLPSPPPSPKLHSTVPSGKRRRDSVDADGGDSDDIPISNTDIPRPQSRRPRSAASILSTARPGSLTHDTLSALAAAYRSAARELKHAADARTSALSASRPSYFAARPTQLSALQQLDAVLLFCYAFWLDDLGCSSSASNDSGGACITKNWISLFGLLRYATNAHSDLGNDVLLGVCRLVEAAVLRKLHAHDSALLVRLCTSKSASMDELEQMVMRQAADLERSDRLARQARTLLSAPTLATTHPDLLHTALHSSLSIADVPGLANMPDPNTASFAWPIDTITPIPHIVAFGRTAIAEHAAKSRIPFTLIRVRSQ